MSFAISLALSKEGMSCTPMFCKTLQILPVLQEPRRSAVHEVVLISRRIRGHSVLYKVKACLCTFSFHTLVVSPVVRARVLLTPSYWPGWRIHR